MTRSPHAQSAMGQVGVKDTQHYQILVLNTHTSGHAYAGKG
ncbi:hypothetical protein uvFWCGRAMDCOMC493_019 [Freshwater phage uvFW-CGR-AMD-COM-C493]|nr:hypothetical protein uvFWCGRAMDCOMC493_019 [Freshwater phage uvFW-CGR-AMD-COM-C493]